MEWVSVMRIFREMRSPAGNGIASSEVACKGETDRSSESFTLKIIHALPLGPPRITSEPDRFVMVTMAVIGSCDM